MDSETIAKMRVAARHALHEEFRGNVEQRGFAVSQAGAQGTSAACDVSSGRPVQRPLCEQIIGGIVEIADRAKDRSERANRALDILEAHPEILEFIELVKTGCVSLY